MKKQQIIGQSLLFAVMMSATANAWAAAFQKWEQDGASLGNYHAGRAAIADDASTNYYNAAGLVRIQNQQLVFGFTPTVTDTRFQGTVAVNSLGTGPQPVTAQGGTFYLFPNMHYAAPLAPNLVFGLSVITPFQSQTNYGFTSNAQYVATQSSIRVIDVAPSLGFAYNDKVSVGFGLDLQYAKSELNYMITSGVPGSNTLTKNTSSSNGYGCHFGVLYQASEQTRLGLNFLSSVKHSFQNGSSHFSGPLANNGAGGVQSTNNLEMNVTLPSATTLSFFHSFNPTWDVMGTAVYTQWNVFDQMMLQNVAGVSGGRSVTIPESYRNTWNYAVGANYHLNEQWFFRTGIGYDETPSNEADRNLQFPSSNQVALALGAHYQATKTLGLDIGWTHTFAANARINNVSQTTGDQVTTTNGSINSSADVYGLEVKWDIV